MIPTKILHIVPSYKPAFVYGGPIFSVGSLCEETANYGNKVTVFTTTANGKNDLPIYSKKPKEVEGVEVFYFKRWTKGHSNFPPLLLYRLLINIKKYDIVHIHSWWNLVVIPAVFICLLRGVQPILSVRGTMSSFTFDEKSNSSKALFHRFIGKYMLRSCTIHVTSQKERKECEKKIGRLRSFNLPNYINLNDAKAEYRTEDNTVFTLVMLSRLHPVKNIELVLESLADISFDFKLMIIGNGEKQYVDQLKTLAQEKGIDGKIEWKGSRNGKEKFQLLASADLFIQMSLTENFGNSIIEAAAVGTPVLISETIGAADYVEKMELGWVVPLKKDIILDTLSRIFRNGRETTDIKAKRKETVIKEFYSKQLYSNYIKEYNRV